MKIKKFIWVFLYFFAAAIPSFFFIYHSISIGNSNFSYLLSGILGIVSYSIFAFQFFLVSRPKFIDKYFGLDKIYRFHIIIAIAALVLGILHQQLKPDNGIQSTFGSAALVILIGISILSILLMINRLFLKIKIVDSLRKFLNNTFKIKYEIKLLFHNLTIAALILLLFHVMMASSMNGNLPFRIIIISYFIIPLSLYFNHKIIKVYFNKNKRFTISEVINETSNIITLKLTPSNSKIFDYMPGQFIYIRVNNPEIPADEHPFSISSSPSQKNYLSVTVKQLGDFTNSLIKAKKGDKVYVDGSFGCFSYLKVPNAKNLCFIAGGIGITPFLSMLRYIAQNDKNKNVILLWGVRGKSEIICNDELTNYTKLISSFKFVPIASAEENFDGEKGFIDEDKIKKYTVDPKEYDFFICGPPVMMDTELNNLRKLNVPKTKIHFEKFSQ